MKYPSVFDGYLTKACSECDCWNDGPDMLGCCYPGPIDHCDAFAEMMEELEKKSTDEEEES